MAKRKQRKRSRQGREITPSKALEIRYRKRLLAITRRIQRLVKRRLIPAIRRLESEFTADSKASARKELVSILNLLNKQLVQTDKNAFRWAESYVKGTNRANERSNFNMFKKLSGVDLKRAIMNEGIDSVLKEDIKLNVKLIKSIPERYFGRLEKIIEDSLLKGRTAGSMIERIVELDGSTTKRAKFIARDQTATISGKLNEVRSTNLGSVGYKWINSRDRRVRGNPSGLYPNAPFDHWDRGGEYYLWRPMKNAPKAPNGKKFKQPPEDGNPGQPIGCRCTAIPVIPIG